MAPLGDRSVQGVQAQSGGVIVVACWRCAQSSASLAFTRRHRVSLQHCGWWLDRCEGHGPMVGTWDHSPKWSTKSTTHYAKMCGPQQMEQVEHEMKKMYIYIYIYIRLYTGYVLDFITYL